MIPSPTVPESSAASRLGVEGAAGAVPSITSVNVPLAVLTFPATSITRTASAYVPSESEVEGRIEYVPPVVTCPCRSPSPSRSPVEPWNWRGPCPSGAGDGRS